MFFKGLNHGNGVSNYFHKNRLAHYLNMLLKADNIAQSMGAYGLICPQDRYTLFTGLLLPQVEPAIIVNTITGPPANSPILSASTMLWSSQYK